MQQHTLCHYNNSDRDLIHQYVLVLAPEPDTIDELYSVIEVDPRAADFRVYTFEERGNPKGVLPREQLTKITDYHHADNSWSVLRVHYLERMIVHNARIERKRGKQKALRTEYKQVLYNLGHTVHTSMNNRMFNRECELIRNERMSYNVFDSTGRDALKQMCASYSKKGAYHYFNDIPFKALGEKVGFELVKRTIKDVKYFIDTINMHYSEVNMKLTIKYWLVKNENGQLSTRAQAARR